MQIYGGTYEDLQAFINSRTNITIDIETTGLNRRKDSIIGIGVSDGHVGYYVYCSYFDPNGNTTLPATDRAHVIGFLQQLKTKKLRTWNGAFDLLTILNYFGVDLVPALDTDGMLLLHTIDENRFNYGLKDVAAEVFGADSKQAKSDLLDSIKKNGGLKNEFYKADPEIIAKYCVQDCLLTHKLIDHFLPTLREEGLWDFFYEEEVMPLYKHVTMPMENAGVRLDMPLLQQSKLDIEKDLADIEQKIQQAIKPMLSEFNQWYMDKKWPPARTGPFAQAYAELHEVPLPKTASGKLSLAAASILKLPDGHHKAVLLQQERLTKAEINATQTYMARLEGWQPHQSFFNLLSTHHLKKLFFDKLKEKPLSRTPTGQPQVDDDFLQLMAAKHDWVKDLIIYRKLTKLNGTYVSRLLEESEDGRFFAAYKQHGTVTGRYSGDFQQLPRPISDEDAAAMGVSPVVQKHTNRIRSFFIADENAVLIDADYESLEPHVFAHISKDPAIKQVFELGHDFYSTVAIRTENLTQYSADKKAPNYLGKLDKGRRQRAKPYALGIAYGEEDFKLHIELGISQEEAKRLVSGYWAGFLELKKVSDANKEHILKHGYIASETGRRRRLYEAKKIADKHGSWILNSLELWKEYKDRGGEYDHMKVMRKKLKNALNAAINYPTQSLAASVVNRAAIAMAKEFVRQNVQAKVVGQIHDEILLSCLVGHEQKACEIMQKSMENVYKLSVRLKAEPVIGTRYSDIK